MAIRVILFSDEEEGTQYSTNEPALILSAPSESGHYQAQHPAANPQPPSSPTTPAIVAPHIIATMAGGIHIIIVFRVEGIEVFLAGSDAANEF